MTSFKDLPVEFRKPVGGYIREADALDKREPRMAYFCKFYGIFLKKRKMFFFFINFSFLLACFICFVF